MRSNEQIIQKVNSYGKGRFICINPRAGKTKDGLNLVIVKCLKTGKLSKPREEKCLKKVSNPFNPRPYVNRASLNPNDIIKLVNKIGKDKFICFNPNAGKNKNGNILITLKCLKTGNISKPVELTYLKNGRKNPFNSKKRSDTDVIKMVNNYGKEKYICINPRSGKTKVGKNLVIVKCLKTGRLSNPLKEESLAAGHNPFNETQNPVELTQVQPLYERLFKKLKIPFIKEYKLGRKRIDYLLFPKTHRIGLEVKQSEKWHSSYNQIKVYRKIGCLKQFRISKVLLSDPLGKHKKKGSISIKQLSNMLIKLKQKENNIIWK